MFFKIVRKFNQLLTYRSINYIYFQHKNQPLIQSWLKLNRCLTISAIKGIKTEDKTHSSDEENHYFTERPNDLQDLDLNDKQFNDLFAFKPIDGLSQQIDYHLLDEMSPTVGKAFNLSAFADKSQTIQMFIKLGVDLSFIERKGTEITEYLLKLDFERDVKPYILFLVDKGVKAEDLGYFLTRNPTVFRQHINDMEIRINYLKSKKFNSQMISTILTKAPNFVNRGTKFIDYKLAFIQKEFSLTADEIRHLITSYPRFALLKDMAFREMTFLFREEFGFNELEIKSMLLKRAVIFKRSVCTQKNHRLAVQVFDFIHNVMKIPHELISRSPDVLCHRLYGIECRHLYLKMLGRDQYDPKQPLYVPLSALYLLEDNEFCYKFGKTSVQDFNKFCKTL